MQSQPTCLYSPLGVGLWVAISELFSYLLWLEPLQYGVVVVVVGKSLSLKP